MCQSSSQSCVWGVVEVSECVCVCGVVEVSECVCVCGVVEVSVCVWSCGGECVYMLVCVSVCTCFQNQSVLGDFKGCMLAYMYAHKLTHTHLSMSTYSTEHSTHKICISLSHTHTHTHTTNTLLTHSPGSSLMILTAASSPV